MLRLAEMDRRADRLALADHLHRPAGRRPRVRRPDTTLARQRLGWHPQVSSEEGLRRTVDWFAAWAAARRDAARAG